MIIEIDRQELDRLLETNRRQAEQIQKLEEEVQRLKELLEKQADSKSAKKSKFTENYSIDRNQRNQGKKTARKKLTGRRTNEAKRKLATVEVDVYPDAVPRDQCIRHRSQLVWRMLDGKAVYIGTTSTMFPSRKICRCHRRCEMVNANLASKSF